MMEDGTVTQLPSQGVLLSTHGFGKPVFNYVAQSHPWYLALHEIL